ncbi:MAG: hypothetical protein WA783_09215 [Phormidesmis sp.]
MKVKYMAALAAASVFGMTALTSCGEPAADTGTDAAGEVDPDADPCAVEESAEPGAADADPCAVEEGAEPEGE